MDVNNSEEFVALMTSFQGRMYAYILSLIADPTAANDILQETNLVLWRKSGEYQMGTNFKAWAFRTANFQVMAHRQRRMRDKLVFDDDFMSTLTVEANTYDETYESRQKKLITCMEKLPERQRDLIQRRYSVGASIKKMAEDLKSTANSLTQALFRARNNLMNCVKGLQEDGI
ncbi:MAG: sigma-70 family RNA polymerase sigma factor [Lentisphaeraceae bacterium]|nr:sigma-70 family RNA polymerase sigma factor [Lentisphaeraceae bacterium]